MKEQWLQLSEKFSLLIPREMLLIFICGLVLFFMVPFSLVIENNLATINKNNSQINTVKNSNKDLDNNINELSSALKQDPNSALKEQIELFESRLINIDEQLLTLTNELIDPIEMRLALMQLLKLQKGVSLVAFEVLPVEPLMFTSSELDESAEPDAEIDSDTVKNADEAKDNNVSLGLYRHGIKITLKGKYFELRNYLQHLEELPWKFFWHNFHYKLSEYPISELKIEIYSLSTNQEFVGV